MPSFSCLQRGHPDVGDVVGRTPCGQWSPLSQGAVYQDSFPVQLLGKCREFLVVAEDQPRAEDGRAESYPLGIHQFLPSLDNTQFAADFDLEVIRWGLCRLLLV